MSAVAIFLGGGNALTKPGEFANALSQHARSAAPASVNGSFLKLHTEGFWCYGAAEDRTDSESVFALNPMSLMVGYAAWRDNQKVEEHMAALGAEPVVLENLPQDLGEHTKGDRAGQKVKYDPQMSVSIQGIEGADTGLKLMYNASSHGGRTALAGLMDEVGKRVEEDPVFFIPLIKLETDSYYNETYKRTVQTPVLEVVGWGDVNGNKAAPVKTRKRAERPPVDEAPKRTRRRRVAA